MAVDKKWFVHQTIRHLRGEGRKGLHCVYGGLNSMLRKAYPAEDPKTIIDTLAASGDVEKRGCKGGVMIYLPGEGPKTNVDVAFAAIMTEAKKKEKK